MHVFWRAAAALVLFSNALATPVTGSLPTPDRPDVTFDASENTPSTPLPTRLGKDLAPPSPDPLSNRIGPPDLDPVDATDFFSSDLSGFDSPSHGSDYGFDSFPDLNSYFPDFGEIFRIQRSTTPEPPFRFPGYVREAFGEGSGPRSGGRRPVRPPRPASSGTRTKVQKQDHRQEKEKAKPTKSGKAAGGGVGKARDYPKIFRFTSDRVNLADFDTKKKMNENYLTLAKGDDLDSDKVKRGKFLILHGGVFEIERSGNGLFRSESNVEAVTASTEDDLYS